MGGLQILSGAAQALTSIVARNLVSGASANCGDVKPVSSTNNVENQKECGFETGGVNPGLATALSSAGGELDVLALLNGEPGDRPRRRRCLRRGRHRPARPAAPAGERVRRGRVRVRPGADGDDHLRADRDDQHVERVV